MEPDYNDIIQLERYLEKSLSEAEALKVEQRLAVEPGFRELYQNEKLLVEGIRYGHLKAQMEVLKGIEASLPTVTGASKEGIVIQIRSYWKPLSVAASILLLAVSVFLLNRPADPKELYAQYFSHYPNVFKGTERSGKDQDAKANPYVAYEMEDYAKAAEGFSEMWKNKETLDPKDRPEVLLLLGNSNLMLGRTEEARDNFISLSKDFDELDDQAQWFLSLCYLKLGKKDAAKVLLEEIVAKGRSNQEKAKELLKKLD